MRLRVYTRVLFCLATVCTVAFAYADKLHYNILINGSPVGESTYEESADGTFSSEASIAVGAVKQTSSISGHFKSGKVIDYKMSALSPQGAVTLTLAAGKLTATVGGKSRELPFAENDGNYAGNLSPALWAGTLKYAVHQLQANPALTTVKVDAKFLDLGASIPVTLNQLQNLKTTIDGQAKIVRRFHVDIATLGGELDLNESDQVVGFDVPVQHLRFVLDGWGGIYADPLAKYPELSQATYKTKTEIGVTMKTRDGVELVCDLVRPDDEEKHPAVLVRTPYGRGNETLNGVFYASRGYVLVTQDCRGREASGGEWDPFVHEGEDGYDTIQWIAQQPWSDGKVGMIGGSYDGYVQWAAAVEKPPALKCIVPQVSPPDAMRNIPYDHGIFALYLDLWWAKIVAGKKTDFSSLQSSLPNPRGLTTLPLSKDDQAVLGKKLTFYQTWLRRTTINDWKGWDYTYHLDQDDVPALHISGTWDGDEIGTHINWATLRAMGRKDQWIVFGPWVHAFNTTHSLGDVEYGKSAIINLDSLYIRWFDTWLKGKDVGMDAIPHVKLFVTGSNKWVNLKDWPDKTMTPRTLYFDRLELVSKTGSYGSETYTNDPAKDITIAKRFLDVDPTQSTTKLNLSAFPRSKAILLKSQPFKSATTIVSPLSVILYFKCSARDTDFYATPVDIAPDGTAHVLGTPGKLRVSYLEGMDKIRPLVPGQTYQVQVVPWDFAHEFAPGHRFAIVVTSSGFPVFSRNLGTGEPIATGTKILAQKNTILMDRKHPSSVSFYVMDAK